MYSMTRLPCVRHLNIAWREKKSNIARTTVACVRKSVPNNERYDVICYGVVEPISPRFILSRPLRWRDLWCTTVGRMMISLYFRRTDRKDSVEYIPLRRTVCGRGSDKSTWVNQRKKNYGKIRYSVPTAASYLSIWYYTCLSVLVIRVSVYVHIRILYVYYYTRARVYVHLDIYSRDRVFLSISRYEKTSDVI